ncbi:MAG: riboflavin synthase [Dehalococcoidia bacterium]|nr:MAG: riboflavin synthase [Dehalococcoidia bacterium]
MFTGIIAEIGKVTLVKSGSLVIGASRVLPRLKQGESIAVNGVCLTVKSLDTAAFSVDIMPETLKRTNLGRLGVGDMVNLEPPLTLDGGLGGHLVQGHVDATGRLDAITWDGESMVIRFWAPPEVMRYIVEKGFIAVDGVSLTVMTRDSSSFLVSLVDYSRRQTILGDRKVGDVVNLEVDIMAKYVERLSQPQKSGITAELLAEHGFL